MDLLDKFGKSKSQHEFKMEYNLSHTFYLQWLQLTNATKSKMLFKILEKYYSK